MANRERKNELKIYLSDKEQYILEQKVKISGMKSKSTFLRRLILYGFVYDIDYSDLREYNYTLGKISGNLNQIAKRMNTTGNVYKADVEEVKKLMNADVSGLCSKDPQGTSPLTHLLGSAQTRPCRKRGKGKTLFRRIRMF